MYPQGRTVWIKPAKKLGTIYEARMMDRAIYIVEDGQGEHRPYSSKELRAADFQCDGCDRHLPESCVGGGPTDPEGYRLADFCFLCCHLANAAGAADRYKAWMK